MMMPYKIHDIADFLLSNDKTITPPFGRFLLPPFLLKKYFHSPAMQDFFRKTVDKITSPNLTDLLFNRYLVVLNLNSYEKTMSRMRRVLRRKSR